MRKLAWTFAARIGDNYQIRLTRPINEGLLKTHLNLLRKNCYQMPQMSFLVSNNHSKVQKQHSNMHLLNCTHIAYRTKEKNIKRTSNKHILMLPESSEVKAATRLTPSKYSSQMRQRNMIEEITQQQRTVVFCPSQTFIYSLWLIFRSQVYNIQWRMFQMCGW